MALTLPLSKGEMGLEGIPTFHTFHTFHASPPCRSPPTPSLMKMGEFREDEARSVGPPQADGGVPQSDLSGRCVGRVNLGGV